ncbi:DNA repair protein complementing XP-C cells isoform X2 [Orussus abietinus]|uniref:DNA repair protein complementing XP-C cells isoform X2 n=1 Tax=Orussus abietinus TaxID=222816 RepID=UPI000626153C|nr:DNA repair protein complementing XP-C cells isoform X2 [Orussus abietinus]
MGTSSDSESSDSSTEFLVSPSKINLSSSFFGSTAKPNLTVDTNDTSDESDEDFIHDEATSAELLAQVVKNLENVQNIEYAENSSGYESSFRSSQARTDPNESLVEVKGNILAEEIEDLLTRGESSVSTSTNLKESKDVEKSLDEEKPPAEYRIPQEGVKITLPSSELILGRRRKHLDLETQLRNKLNQRRKSIQVFIHKVGLLCWLAYGFHLNRQVNDTEILSVALSFVAAHNYPKNRADLEYLEKFTKWFKSIFVMENDQKVEGINKDTLLIRLKERKVKSYMELVLLYIAMLRGMGINCRLVVSLYPPPLKVHKEELLPMPGASKEKEEKSSSSKVKIEEERKKPANRRGKNSKDKSKKVENTKSEESPQKIVPENSLSARLSAKVEARKKAAVILHGKSKATVEKSDSQECAETSKQDTSKKKGINLKALKSDKLNSNASSSQKTVSNDKVESGRVLRSRATTNKAPSKAVEKMNTESSDTETSEEEEPLPKKKQGLKLSALKPSADTLEKGSGKNKQPAKRKNANSKAQKSKDQIDRRLLSSDDENESQDQKRTTYDIWAEVYLESEENWISVSVPDGKIHCVSEIYKKAASPVLYVVAWNSVSTLRDVTRRYCPQWLTVTRKQRVDEKWWSETLSYWKERETALTRAEDEMLLQRELEQPLPKTVGECKGHPLYALARHLLKYEALYPPDCVPLGHLHNGEAIYSRHCVHTLCSRETWLRKARVVKPAQEPYKIVKALPKYDKLSGAVVKGQALEIFGKWQTTQYVPPEAKDGKVPRNEYGNVDLFKMCMLPKGTVHIDLPGLNRIARKLDIDCAPAVVGFNFGGMGAVPALEGYVVCSEYEDTLREAWEVEQVEARKRAKEKREKRVYGNWRKLIKGLFIRERLAVKYEFGNDKEVPTTSSNKRAKQKPGCSKKTKVSRNDKD